MGNQAKHWRVNAWKNWCKGDNDREEILTEYAEGYNEILESENQTPVATIVKPHSSVEQEEKEFDRLKKEYQNLLATTNTLFSKEPELMGKYFDERNQFEQEFVEMNCDLQNHRSEVHQLLESVAYNEKFLAVDAAY